MRNTPQTYVNGPDTFRMELVEDPRLPAPVVSHHLHYWLEHPADVKKWYVQKLLLKPTMRGPYESGDVPGMNLTLAPLGSQKVPGVPTKGRLMDSIGFDLADLQALYREVQSQWVTFDVPYGRDPELGLMSATLTDPWGVTHQADRRAQQDCGRYFVYPTWTVMSSCARSSTADLRVRRSARIRISAQGTGCGRSAAANRFVFASGPFQMLLGSTIMIPTKPAHVTLPGLMRKLISAPGRFVV